MGIRVTDLDRSLRFYRDGLGLVERKRGTMSRGGTWAGLEGPTSLAQLEPNVCPTHSPYVPGEGLDHLGLEVVDARAAIDRLRRGGARVAVEPWLEDGRYGIGFVEDPEGNWVELPDALAGPSTGP
jgi:lactoylglutathione lyase